LKIVHVPSKAYPKLSFLREPPISTTQEQTAEKVIKLEPIVHRHLARAGDGDGAVAPPGPGLTVALQQGRPASLTAETGTLRRRLLAAAVSQALGEALAACARAGDWGPHHARSWWEAHVDPGTFSPDATG
jgi:hypothetical protein